MKQIIDLVPSRNKELTKSDEYALIRMLRTKGVVTILYRVADYSLRKRLLGINRAVLNAIDEINQEIHYDLH